MKRIPNATYRLQFNREFTFRQAIEILDYLRELGVSDVYASPLFQAGPDSTHGYDTCCFGKINSNLGSTEDFEHLTGALKERDMGLLLDVVPNHMSATLSNAWWLDVLRNGRESRYAKFFDIDWQPNNPALHDKVLLPVLEDHYGKVLESGKLRLTSRERSFFISYYDRNFPVNEASIRAHGNMDPAQILEQLNGKPGNARSFDQLDALIQRQHYRLAYWRIGSEEINYRRFFDVTEMVALKMELPEVFDETHQLIFDWLQKGKITGLRIDHPDGLWNPKEYLERLQKNGPRYVVVEKILSGDERLASDWPADGTTGYDFLNRVNGLFVDGANAAAFDGLYRDFTGSDTNFAEIVYASRKQVLQRSFASELNGLSHRLKDIAASTPTGCDFTFSELREALAEVIATFPVYRTYITETSTSVSEADRKVIEKAVATAQHRSLRNAEAIELINSILLQQQLCPSPNAGAVSPSPPRSGGEGRGEVALRAQGEDNSQLSTVSHQPIRHFLMKFQQLTGPAMAKGLEDTAFYRFNRLISLNEVGGEPERFGLSPAEFHEANCVILEKWPHTMLASSTHDTKRGEDLRARLNVLSEMPGEWRDAINRWARLNQDKKSVVQNAPTPDANDEYLLYQTLVGAWRCDADAPERLRSFLERVSAFMLKAVKEAKLHTSWTDPNPEYEKAVQSFIESILTDNAFLDDLSRFARRVAFFGGINSLSQTLLKMTCPGVPDFYQGSELGDLNLVDPDNRRPVDYLRRKELLSDLKTRFEAGGADKSKFFSELLQSHERGIIKLFVIWRTLNYRRTHRDLFGNGSYLPVTAIGEKKEHVCAFVRERNGLSVITIVPRLVFGLTGGAESPPLGDKLWGDTALSLPNATAKTQFRNVLTNEIVTPSEGNSNLGEIFRTFPVALLEKI